MNLTFIKVNFIIFEIVSIFLLGVSIGSLVYFSVFISMKSGMKKNNLEVLPVSYTYKHQTNVYADYVITLADTKPEMKPAFIIVNKAYFPKDETKEKKIEKINKSNPTNIFLFQEERQANNLISKILDTLRTSSNFFNCAIGFLVIVFFVFMKITLVRTSMKKIQQMKSNRVTHSLLGTVNKEDSKVLYDPSLSLLTQENIFNFLIFHATYLLIIPFLFPDLLDYQASEYMGFRSNFFSSVYYYRSNFGQKDFATKPNFHGSEPKLIPRFMLHYFEDFKKYRPSQINHYLLNLAFLCCAVWVSQYFNVFNAKQTATSTMEKKKESKVKKYLKLAVVVVLFLIWGAFLAFALVTFLDYFYLFHGLITFSFVRITDPLILLFIIVFYYHVYFYVLMGIYTFRIIYKNKQYEKSQSEKEKEEESRSRTRSDLALRLLSETDLTDLVLDKKNPNGLVVPENKAE